LGSTQPRVKWVPVFFAGRYNDRSVMLTTYRHIFSLYMPS